MNKGLYVATAEPHSGKSLIVLGLMQLLLGKTGKVGYFRPVIDDQKKGEVDNHINTVLSHYELDLEPKEAYAFTRSEIIALGNKNHGGKIIDTIIDKFKKLERRFDFVLVEGSDFSGEGGAIEFNINVQVAKNLGIPAVIVGSGVGKTKEHLCAGLQLAVNSFKLKEVEVLAVVANKVSRDELRGVKDYMLETLPEEIQSYAIPRLADLSHPTLKEILNTLDGQVLFGEEFLDNQTGSFGVGAMQLRNYLTHLRSNSLVITPGDRADIILGALQANLSENYPQISGIILTGGIIPETSIMKLIEGFDHRVPIISVQQGTFGATNDVGNIRSRIYAESKQKIQTSIELFEKYIDQEKLSNSLVTFEPEGITPRMFQYNLVQRAKQEKKHIVLPEGNDHRILTAASRLLALNIVDITLLGDKTKIERKAAQLGLNIEKAKIIDPLNAPMFEEYVSTLYELRKHKNVNQDMARDMMTDVSYFGTMMVYLGHADGMVSGAVHTTQHTIRPALQFVKTKPGVSVVSSIFFMCLEDRVSVFGDCAINPNPTAPQLAEIAISSADSSLAFGIEPKVAMLSYSSGASGKGEDVETVRAATEIVKQKRPDIKIEGPIQYDAAVDMSVAKSKLPSSEVAGQASVLIFPDLNTGNNTYKAVQRETGALAIGPMLQGLNKPVNDLSRGCTIDDVFNTVVITAIQAQGI
ncbi:phosphate acetyltransferase [Sungkyunkwania multivorans]|uniref:Phosphate acetyltransferase n=1 Tax=Sungkyunkwania multivorans TaxID=1173618 RepID=A0ABW3CWP5_9FLAO